VKPTIQNLLDKNPCSDGVKFIKSHKSLRKMWAICKRADWMIWALRQFRLLDERAARIFAADCAEHTLHFFEAAYPDDKRPRQAIEFARTLIDNPGSAWSFTAADSAWSATLVASRASRASRGARAAARAGESAGWSAGESAGFGWSAAESSRAAAGAAAGPGARAARAAENKWQADKLRELINPFASKRKAVLAKAA